MKLKGCIEGDNWSVCTRERETQRMEGVENEREGEDKRERKRNWRSRERDRVKGRAESRKTKFFSEHHSTFYYVKYEVTINDNHETLKIHAGIAYKVIISKKIN